MKICASLRHEFVVQYLRTLHEADWLTVLMEYAAGGSLKDRLESHRSANSPFEPITVATWLAQLGSAVAYIHSEDVLHRDLSASNVFLTHTDTASAAIKIGDFGLSREGTKIGTGAFGTTMCGTPTYASPELINGEQCGPPSDVWAVGVLAYELLTLSHPFSSASGVGELFRAICASKPSEPGLLDAVGYPGQIKAVASPAHLLHPDPGQRMTIEELLEVPRLRRDNKSITADVRGRRRRSLSV